MSFTRIINSTTHFLFLFLFFSYFLVHAKLPNQVIENLGRVYNERPSLVVNFNETIFYQAAVEIIGEEAAMQLKGHLVNDFADFAEARDEFVRKNKVNIRAGLPRIIVSGQSVSGMVYAAIAAQAGYKVTVYEKRTKYQREIQWALRQAMADQLASIDRSMAGEFIDMIAKGLPNGSGLISTNGEFRYKFNSAEFSPPDPRRVPETGRQMLEASSVGTVAAKQFELFLAEYTRRHPNITRYHGIIDVKANINTATGEHIIREYVFAGDGKKVRLKKNDPNGKIVLIAEGAGSNNRKKLGIKVLTTSPQRLQVAGIIHINRTGEITESFTSGRAGTMVTSSMGTLNSGKRWLVTDIYEGDITPNKKDFGTDTESPAYKEERQRLLELIYRKIAARNLRIPENVLLRKTNGKYNIKVTGAIEGKPLTTFSLAQKMSERGTSGSNVILMGDALGNAHWSVGGGVQTAAISHAERFKIFLLDLEKGINRAQALEKLNHGIVADTNAWGAKGFKFFLNGVPEDQAIKAYWKNFEEELKREERGKTTLSNVSTGGRLSCRNLLD